MTPAFDKQVYKDRIPKYIPKYIPSKYPQDNWLNPKSDWYDDPYDPYYNPAQFQTQITAQAVTAISPMIDTGSANTTAFSTTSFTTNPVVNITFAGTIDQAAVDAITNQLKVSLNQQQSSFIPDPPKRRIAPREFNKYINGSDLVEQFIRYCGTLGVRQGEVMDIPIDSFIKWLIIEACVVDQEEPEVTLELGPSPQPRCLGCGRYVPRGSQVLLHDERCAGFHFRRQKKQMEVAHARSDSLDGGDRRVLSGVGAPGT